MYVHVHTTVWKGRLPSRAHLRLPAHPRPLRPRHPPPAAPRRGTFRGVSPIRLGGIPAIDPLVSSRRGGLCRHTCSHTSIIPFMIFFFNQHAGLCTCEQRGAPRRVWRGVRLENLKKRTCESVFLVRRETNTHTHIHCLPAADTRVRAHLMKHLRSRASPSAIR